MKAVQPNRSEPAGVPGRAAMRERNVTQAANQLEHRTAGHEQRTAALT